jgi:hypothetical protein
MSGLSQSPAFYIGWDVGVWNCDKSAQSRSAIVILDANWRIVGKLWRGNPCTTSNASNACENGGFPKGGSM